MCTGISYKTISQHEFFGRTQEYDVDYDYAVIQFPRNYAVPAEIYPWQTTHSVLGVGTLADGQVMPMVLDGINEHGLAASTQYFADDFRYASVEDIKAAGKEPVYAELLIFYLLSQCETIDHVIDCLDTIGIPNVSIVKEGGLPQHFFLKDLSGRSIVIEPSIPLGFKVFENPIGVMTNGPTFDWHLTNLRNYSGLTKTNRPNMSLDKLEIPSFGKGTGLISLPGDFTSPARFIRSAMLLNLSQPVTEEQGPNFGFHILATVDIPKGVIADGISVQYTQYTSLYNQTDLSLYIKLYDNLAIQRVTLDSDFLTCDQPKVYQLQKTPHYYDLT